MDSVIVKIRNACGFLKFQIKFDAVSLKFRLLQTPNETLQLENNHEATSFPDSREDGMKRDSGDQVAHSISLRLIFSFKRAIIHLADTLRSNRIYL